MVEYSKLTGRRLRPKVPVNCQRCGTEVMTRVPTTTKWCLDCRSATGRIAETTDKKPRFGNKKGLGRLR